MAKKLKATLCSERATEGVQIGFLGNLKLIGCGIALVYSPLFSKIIRGIPSSALGKNIDFSQGRGQYFGQDRSEQFWPGPGPQASNVQHLFLLL